MVNDLSSQKMDAPGGVGLDFQALGQIVREDLKKPYDISMDSHKMEIINETGAVAPSHNRGAMSDITQPKARDTKGPSHVVLGEIASAVSAPPAGMWLRRILDVAGLREVLVCLFLASITITTGFADATTDPTLLPIEILGANGTTVSRTVILQAGQAESARSLWLQIHGLQYADEASVQVNASAWIPLNNNTVAIAEPARSFGGIGGGFATLVMTLPLPNGTVVAGANTIRFRFDQTDGVVSAYRVLAWNLLSSDGGKLLLPNAFAEDAPETWTPPLPDAASIQAGRELWHNASLAASSLPNSPRIQAHCADCHAQDGRDLKYFNFSNASIVARSRFHGLSTTQGEQIASYIRSLPLPNPGRPWDPPYQPGPGLDEKPISRWAAGAGLSWVLDQDTEALPYLLGHDAGPSRAASNAQGSAPNLGELVGQIAPDIFRPDANLNPRQIPVALQFPDWSHWLPRVHPKDAWGPAFIESEFATLYGAETTAENKTPTETPLRKLLAANRSVDHDGRSIIPAFAQWSEARRKFLRRFVSGKTPWSLELANKVYSTQLWQLVKTWEMMQEYGLEGRGRDFFGSTADARTWCNTIPIETAPSAENIPDGPSGIGGSALTNEYFNASWYELQIVLNSGNHQHRDHNPLDWVYVVRRFLDLYGQTHQPEPTRLLVAITKALQSTDPHMGPENLSQGWRPDQNIDPRIMISPAWSPIFKPMPTEVHRALTASLLSAWLDKNLQYPIADYLPLSAGHTYVPPNSYADISGGKAWESAQQFRNAGVGAELVQRLQQWGFVFTDRAARIQYGH